jgi:hypothetical protein
LISVNKKRHDAMKRNFSPIQPGLIAWLVYFPIAWSGCHLAFLAEPEPIAAQPQDSEWNLSPRILTGQIGVRPAVADLDKDGNRERLIGYSSIRWLADRPQHLDACGKPEFIELAKSRKLTIAQKQADKNLLIFPGIAGGEGWDWGRARWLADDTRLAALPVG